MPPATPTQVGKVFLPNSGTNVGRFQFLVEEGEAGDKVEIGTAVTADTAEGPFIGIVIDLSTIGDSISPLGESFQAAFDEQLVARKSRVRLATVQVYWSQALRSIGDGNVRGSTSEEVGLATGLSKMSVPISAGVVMLIDGSMAPITLDLPYLLGSESAHLQIGGLSGLAAKTSFASVLLRSAINAADGKQHKVGALIFNVKGDDLLYLDEGPSAGYELTEEDLKIYQAMGVPAEPFEDVQVWSPSLPGGEVAASPRLGASILRWDLSQVLDYLPYVIPELDSDEKLVSFLAEFRDRYLNHPNPSRRISTFGQLERHIDTELDDARNAEGVDKQYTSSGAHVATVRRLRRMLLSMVYRCGGLITNESSDESYDIPMTAWRHGQVVVVDIAGLATDVQGLVIARTCERLLAAAEEGSLGVNHVGVFADELNAFAPAQGGDMAAVKRILERIATQGRYAGVSLWGASQKMSKISEMLVSNSATRVLGVTSESELDSGIYGKLSAGLAERIATLSKGSVAIWHHAFRGSVVVRFPRPAWRTGRAQTGGRRQTAIDTLGLEVKNLQRLSEGMNATHVASVVTKHDGDTAGAMAELAKSRVPNMKKTKPHVARVGADPNNPFGIEPE